MVAALRGVPTSAEATLPSSVLRLDTWARSYESRSTECVSSDAWKVVSSRERGQVDLDGDLAPPSLTRAASLCPTESVLADVGGVEASTGTENDAEGDS